MSSQLHGLDMTALAAMATAFGIEQDQRFFEKLRAFEGACIAIWSGNIGCTKQKKANCAFKHGVHLEWACERCPENPKKQ